ncbi:MAG: hypothetical protein ABEK59_09515 [Halobacteria archaeon]
MFVGVQFVDGSRLFLLGGSELSSPDGPRLSFPDGSSGFADWRSSLDGLRRCIQESRFRHLEV